MTDVLTTVDPVVVWTEVLCSYAATLDDQRSFLLAMQPDGLAEELAVLPPAYVVPAGLPPLPAELASWARSLQTETSGLAELAADVLARTRPPTADRPRRSAAMHSSSIDQKL